MTSPSPRFFRDPLVMIGAALPLVLGSAVIIAILSLVYGLLAKPFPWYESERLVYVYEEDPDRPERSTSTATFVDWRRAKSFSDLSALRPLALSLTDRPRPESPFSRRVTADYFDVFGIAPLLGRVFTAEEEARGAKVAIVSRALWQRQFDADPNLIGQTMEIDHEPHVVLGVMEFVSPREPAPVELWLPLHLPPQTLGRARRPIAVWGHLAPGVTPAEAEQELAALAAEVDPAEQRGRQPRVVLVADDLVGDFRATLHRLFVAGLVLLLFLGLHAGFLAATRVRAGVRGSTRTAALGAMISGLVGIFLSPLALGYFASLVPLRFGVPPIDHLGIDVRVSLGALAVIVIAVAGSAWLLRRPSTENGGSPGLLRAVVGLEVAFALVLAGGAVLATEAHRERGRAGLDEPGQVLTLRMGMRGPDYNEPMARVALLGGVLKNLGRMEGAAIAAATNLIPVGRPIEGAPFTLADGATAAATAGTAAGDRAELRALPQVVTPAYFEALGIELVEGREFTAEDTTDAPPVAIVNQRFVDVFLGGRALARQLTAGNGPRREIVGVVADSRAHEEPATAVATIYLPHSQQPARTMTFFVRTTVEPATLKDEARSAIAALDRYLPVYDARSLDEILAEADWRSRFTMVLLLFFAALAVLSTAGAVLVASRPENLK